MKTHTTEHRNNLPNYLPHQKYNQQRLDVVQTQLQNELLNARLMANRPKTVLNGKREIKKQDRARSLENGKPDGILVHGDEDLEAQRKALLMYGNGNILAYCNPVNPHESTYHKYFYTTVADQKRPKQMPIIDPIYSHGITVTPDPE